MIHRSHERKVLVERRQRVLALTLNRPDCLNAIDNDLARELLAALEEGSRDPSPGRPRLPWRSWILPWPVSSSRS